MTETGPCSLLKLMITLTVGCTLFACASSPTSPPNELMTQTELSIDAAEHAEARREAPVALRSAKNHLAAAKRSMRDEEYDAATRQLQRALADAEYATMKSRSQKMQQAAKEVERTLDILQEELESSQSS